MVGVILTSTCVKVLGSAATEGEGVMWMSGRFTTASWPSDSGCSGSEIVEMRSAKRQSSDVDKGCDSDAAVSSSSTQNRTKSATILMR